MMYHRSWNLVLFSSIQWNRRFAELKPYALNPKHSILMQKDCVSTSSNRPLRLVSQWQWKKKDEAHTPDFYLELWNLIEQFDIIDTYIGRIAIHTNSAVQAKAS